MRQGYILLGSVTLTPGARLGRFEILSCLGQGGMGEVFRARDTRLGRDVALKTVSATLISDPGSLRRFEREARALAALSHSNIVPVFDVGEEGGIRFVVTELVEGETLRAHLASGPLPPAEAAEIAAQVAEGLAAAHEKGVIHRDIKPENLILSGGRVRILDFGLASLAGPEEAGESAVTQEAVTEPGVVAGTPAYMSPEQARGEKLDTRSDIFSLGSVFYEMLTGRKAFSAVSRIETLSAILRDDPAFPTAGPSTLRPDIERVARRCLAKNRDARYHSAADLAHDLRALALGEREPTGGPAGPLPMPPSPVRRRRLGLLALAAVAAAALALLLWRLQPATVRAPRTLAVLPFRSLGADVIPRFGLGLADSVIGQLARLRPLTVRPTSAIRRFETEPVDAIEAGRALHVDAVLEGTVQRVEGVTRVSVQLTDVSRGAIVWSSRLELPEGKLFAVQDEIAQRVAEGLRLELDPQQRRSLASAQPVSDRAMEQYVAVRARLSEVVRFSPKESREVLSLLDRILDEAPGFAQAIAARSYVGAWQNFFIFSPTGYAAVLRDADRALALDPDLVEPRLARTAIIWSSSGGWDFVAAATELATAIRKNPGLDLARLDLSRLFTHYGWLREAERELGAAQRINPSSPETIRLEANIAWFRGDRQQALREYLRLPADLRRQANAGRWQILQIRLQSENPLPLMEEVQAWLAERPPDRTLPTALLAVARARAGNRDIADLERQIAAADERIGHFHHVWHLLAEAHAQRGDASRSVDFLRRAAKAGLPCIPCFETDRLLAPIRVSPGYVSLIQELRVQETNYRQALKGAL